MSARKHRGEPPSEGPANTSGADYPRRRTAAPSAPEPSFGYRATKRSSKLGKRMRREAKSERIKQQVEERVHTAGERTLEAFRMLGIVLGGAVAVAVVVFLLANGVNATARWLARRDAERAASPEARAEQARGNLLIISADTTSGADFLAVRLDEENDQILGIAIPSGAFMEVPGQGYERVGDSFHAGPDVSLAAISNYLSVPFDRHVVVPSQVYQDAMTNQSLRDVMANLQSTDLTEDEQARITGFVEQVPGERTALVPLPVKPIDLGGQTFFEPQRDQIADLLLQWWDVRVGAEDQMVRVIIYNGVGTPGIAGAAAQQLITAGMRVVDTKNADRFDYDSTLIVVQDGDVSQGDAVRDALGTGEVVDQPSPQDVADVIVIIGKDYKAPANAGS